MSTCHYCDHDKYPNGKPIDPTTDIHAKQTERGDWKCGVCTIMDLIEMNKVSSSE